MKKICFLLIISMLFSLVSCHGAPAGEKEEAPEFEEFEVPDIYDESKQIEITFWAKNDTNITQTRIYEKAIADFTAIYPNIKVNLRLYTDYSRIYNDVITNISTNTTPNVCITYPDHVATYLEGNNIVVPLDDLMSDPKYGLGGSEIRFDSVKAEEIVSKFLNEGKIDGVQYALPYMRSTEACYINKTYVEALGYTLPEKLTWDFVFEVSEAAMDKDGNGNFKVNGQKVLIPFIYKSTDNMMIQMLRQKGAPYSTSEGEIQIFNDTTKNILMDLYSHGSSRAFSTFKISSYPANFLNAGQCIFAIDSTAGATWMGTNAPLCDISQDKIVDFETVVMEIPQYDTENPKMISQGPSICIFNKEDRDVVVASWLFAQYLLTNDVQIAYSQTEGYLPVTHKAQDSEEYKEYISRSGEDNDFYYNIKIDAAKLLMRNIDNTFVTPVFNGSASLRDASGQMIENVIKSARRKQKVDDKYIEKLYSDMISLYRLENVSDGNAVTGDSWEELSEGDASGVLSGDASQSSQASESDARSSENDNKENLGKMPASSSALIAVLVSIWVFLAIYTIFSKIKRKKQSSK